MSKFAAPVTAAAQWVRHRIEEGRERGSDRGDISITTVIIWVAGVGGALLIAGTIAVVVTRYNGILSGI